MLYSRSGRRPQVDASARIARSAQIVGDVTLGPNTFVDHNVVIESSGAPVHVDAGVVILAGSVIRSTGGSARPPFGVRIGGPTLIGPLCALVGCTVGSRCYVATSVMIFHGAEVGDGSRISAGAVVHTRARLPAGSHVGLRGFAVEGPDGAALVTYDVAEARRHLANSDFFGAVFEAGAETVAQQNEAALERMFDEIRTWQDEAIRF